VSRYPAGIDLVIAKTCPVGANHPMACTFCAFGHMTECHHPLTCSQAECGHYVAQRQLEACCEMDDLPDPFDDSGEDEAADEDDESVTRGFWLDDDPEV